jgi:acetyl esterase
LGSRRGLRFAVCEPDPQVAALLDRMAASGAPPVGVLPVAELRRNYEASAPAAFGPGAPMASVEETKTDDGIPVRIYRPVETGERSGALVYFHGGGWVVGSLDSHDGVVRALAHGSGRVAIAVDYRLAPEHPFPAGIDDATAATSWVLEHADLLQIDPARVAVAGDSSGATLAAVVARRLPVEAQLLICPVVDHRFDTESYEELAEGYFLTRDAMRWYWAQYLAGDDGTSPDASPLRAQELAGLPRTLIVIAGCDPLRDEGLTYAAKLEQAGVPVTLLRYDGMIHNFIRFAASIDRAAEALANAAALLV